MSLAVSSRNYEGQLLCYQPGYGWGWYRLDKTGDDAVVDYAQVDRAGAFHIRVHRFFSIQAELRGIVGRVEHPDHMFDQMWTATWIMVVGEWDLTVRLCPRWDIELGPFEPSGDEWPQMREASPVYSGHGVLGVSRQALSRYFESLR